MEKGVNFFNLTTDSFHNDQKKFKLNSAKNVFGSANISVKFFENSKIKESFDSRES